MAIGLNLRYSIAFGAKKLNLKVWMK